MKPQIATNPEQSNRLIACGVDLTTADMCWTQRTHRIDGSPIKKSHQKANLWLGYPCKRELEDDEQRIDTPAWSLGALLALLPYGDGQEIKFIYDPFDEDRNLIPISNPIELSGDVKLYRNDSNYWIVDYDWDGFQGTLPHGKDPIEAVVQAVELLCANNVSLNTPLIFCKVYEAILPETDSCKGCAFQEEEFGCIKAHCHSFKPTNFGDAKHIFRFSPELTDKLKGE